MKWKFVLKMLSQHYLVRHHSFPFQDHYFHHHHHHHNHHHHHHIILTIIIISSSSLSHSLRVVNTLMFSEREKKIWSLNWSIMDRWHNCLAITSVRSVLVMSHVEEGDNDARSAHRTSVWETKLRIWWDACTPTSLG